MTNQSTIDKLIEMRLTAMADAFRIQMDDPAMKEVPFEDRFGMLVDVEYSNRKNNRLKRLIRQAEFEQPDASIAAIDYHSGRKLNKALINRLATCEYITEYRNIFITGATGSGKTYMACAFGMEACKHYYSVRYVRLPDLLLDLQAARDNGTFSTALKKYTKPIVLIIDEWLLLKLTEAEARNLFEPIHKRRKILQQSFVLNSVKVNGTSKSVMVKVLLPMPSWIVYRMIPIRSILKVLTHLKTSL